MSVTQRLAIIAAVVVVHLALLIQFSHKTALTARHKEMTVSFASSDGRQEQRPSSPRPAFKPLLREAAPTAQAVGDEPDEPQAPVTVTTGAGTIADRAMPTAPQPYDEEPDYQASYLNNIAPAYPLVARRMGWQGTVQISVQVLADGSAGQVELARSSGHAVLDEAALRSVRAWRFTPARHAGLAVDRWFLVPIPFVLKESE